MKLMLDCKAVSRLISQGQDADLPPADRARMQLHFVACRTCRNVEEQMAFLRRAMQSLELESADRSDDR
jgi:predicted anti-sigma-YlaC factor YlaD